ncbi:MAG: hypothetical protein M3312_00975 [Actinomycetota bacterium]|nr:hypothetical protein [Actinomycetota bacterium]
MKAVASSFAAALAFAVFAASAAAKEIESATICGPSDCTELKDREKAAVLAEAEGPGSPPPASSFYTLELRIDAEDQTSTFTIYYVPSAAMARPAREQGGDAGPSSPVWSRVTPAAARLLKVATRGLEPFPKPQLSSVEIGSKTVVDGADSYLRLFELPRTSGALPSGLPVVYSEWIDLRSQRPSPWTDGSRDLSFSPRAGLLERGGQVVRIPEELLADVRAGRALSTPGGGGFPWPTLAGGLAATLAGAFVIALLLRRRRTPARPGAAAGGDAATRRA